jgi:hypothetical protein
MDEVWQLCRPKPRDPYGRIWWFWNVPTDELEARRTRPRVSRFVLAIWDTTVGVWFIEGTRA